MRAVDLHVHSNKSDGTFSPAELVTYAVEKNLRAFALTDHDTIDGIAAAMEQAQVLRDAGQDIEVIPGIEFSTEYLGRDIHIVGLYIPYTDPAFVERLHDFQDSRTLRNRKMCALLAEHGIEITYEKLAAAYPDAVLTRAHFANYLVHVGACSSTVEAFDRYIGDHCSCFVPREKITPEEAVSFLREHGAIAILAHPVLYHLGKNALDTLVALLTEAGLTGIEAIYSTYAPSDERDIRALALKYKLKISGGSDFHGANKSKIDLAVGTGHLFVPETVLDDLQTLLTRKILFSDMDGTLLLDADKTISPETKAAINEMTARGHKFVLTSGRPLSNMLNLVESLDFHYPGLYIISYNGAVVYDCDARKIIYSRKVSLDLVKAIFDEADAAGISCNTYYKDMILTNHTSPDFEYYINRIQLKPYYSEDLHELIDDEPYKVLTISREDRAGLEAFQRHMQEKYGDRLTIEFSSRALLEFFHPEAGKGNALRFLSHYLGVPIENTYSAGDQFNDISMIEAAGTGFAMLNAEEDVKKCADQITPYDNNHNGIEWIIRQFVL